LPSGFSNVFIFIFNLIHFFLIFFEAPTYASSDSCHLQQSINTKKLEIENENMYESKLSTKLEKLREDIEKQNDIIADSEKKLTRLELEKKLKQENEQKYRDEREKIEVKIKQLQKESSNTCDLERSLHDDIDRMSQAERNLQYLISQSKCKKKEMSNRHQDESQKERKCFQTINSLQLELRQLELEINFRYQPRQRPYSNENGKY
jgi:chromosome segregation ATPase